MQLDYTQLITQYIASRLGWAQTTKSVALKLGISLKEQENTNV